MSNLNTLYAKFSRKWHKTIVGLGYLDAYSSLVNFDAHRRTDPAEHVLDVGTGTGALAKVFVEQHPKIKLLSLLDSSPEMLREARLNLSKISCKTRCIEGLLCTSKIQHSSIDTLLCAHVVEHTLNPVDSLQWFFDILRPNGTLILSVSKPHWCTSIVRWRWGHKAFSPDEFCSYLRKAGFTSIETVSYLKGPPSRTSCGYRAIKPNNAKVRH